MVVCNETSELSDCERLRLCMWSGFWDESGKPVIFNCVQNTFV